MKREALIELAKIYVYDYFGKGNITPYTKWAEAQLEDAAKGLVNMLYKYNDQGGLLEIALENGEIVVCRSIEAIINIVTNNV